MITMPWWAYVLIGLTFFATGYACGKDFWIKPPRV